ncbi:MAG: radical SAM protein [Candidatus Omnitrophica bacterium]|nr:radical SAM protein [Candidatus Omnitrophota bacterium]
MSHTRRAISFLPTTAVLEMTYQCNHRCLFCSCPWMAEDGAFVKGEELSTDQWKSVLDLLSRKGIQNICFTGGEALLRSDLPQIMEYAAQLKVQIIKEEAGQLVDKTASPQLYLLSNGTFVDDIVLDRCKKYHVQLSVSMPGLSAFSELTGGGDVNKILRLFGKARDKGLSTVVGVTVTKKNLFELYETISAAFLAGATQLLLNRFLYGGRGRRYARELSLSREELTEMLDVAEQALKDAGRYGSVGTEIPLCLFRPEKYQRLDMSTGCSAAKGFFVIGPSGKVRVCNHSQVELAHYSGIDTLKTDSYWMKFVQSDYLPTMCAGCHDIGRCAGGCREAAHINAGAIDAPDAFFIKEGG